jgi:DNA-binding transcriptional LysR family regulator
MDKLRALEYFVAAADERSFSAAARKLQVSAVAVSKLVGVLEAGLRVALFERHARGLTLTAGGATYLEVCKPVLAQLQQADALLTASTRDIRGTVVIGVQHIVACRFLVPALPVFMQRHPEIQIDLRDFTQVTDAQTSGIDIFLRMGWVDADGLVLRRLATERFVVCAAPAYWAAHGMPQRPSDLRNHKCLLLRNALNSTMDLWEFERGAERESVVVQGQLIAGNAHVFACEELGMAGLGVVLAGELGGADLLAAGKLVPVLADWNLTFRPPVSLLYRSSARRIPRVKCFIDFFEEHCRTLEASRQHALPPGVRPVWTKRGYDKTSASRPGEVNRN